MRTLLVRIYIVIASLGVLGACTGWFMSRRGDSRVPQPGSARAPVIVELFSSEGCSSCPPADAYVSMLDRTQPVDGVEVIALEEHVDYWDRLGWRDPFGDPAFSRRQGEYARALGDRGVFTPEVVFDGYLVMPGGAEDAARAMMQEAARKPKASVSLRRDGSRVRVDVAGVPASSAGGVPTVWLAVTESGLATDVPAGENAGQRLAHAPVVRRLRSLGNVTGAAFHAEATLDLAPTWKPAALRVVAFVQLGSGGRIAGAAAL